MRVEEIFDTMFSSPLGRFIGHLLCDSLDEQQCYGLGSCSSSVHCLLPSRCRVVIFTHLRLVLVGVSVGFIVHVEIRLLQFINHNLWAVHSSYLFKNTI